MTRIYSLVNQKGGVGKTTTAISLGAYLAQMGLKVLLVDLDPQANATSCLGVARDEVRRGTYEALIGHIPPGDAIMHNRRLRLSLLPSTPELAGAQVEMVSMPEREQALRRAMAFVQDGYDYIFIDCPPSLGLLTLNGLIAGTHGAIIPVQCEYLALEGLSQLMRTLDRVRRGLFPGLTIRGLLLTMFDGRTNLAKDVAEEVRSHFPQKVFESIIPRSVRLAEAPSHGLPISAYAPHSPGAVAYARLAMEIAARDGVSLPEPTLEIGSS